jgi:2-dehydropantoate 2-reductase
MKHAVLGVGAIGGLVGTALASLGEGVTVVVRAEALTSYPRTLSLERNSSSITAPVAVVAALEDPVDVLWIATKTYQLDTALETVRATPARVVPLLNGVDHIRTLEARFGRPRVIAATIAVEAERVASGRFIQRSPFARLNFAASGAPFFQTLAARLSEQGFSCQFMPNEQTLLWSKLCFLGPLALSTSASGLDIGGLFANVDWKRKLLAAIDEACAVAKASGAEVDPRQIQGIAQSMPPAMRSSMQKDLAAGRQLELDAIGGPIVRGGQRFEIDVSTTAELVAAILAKSSPLP